jgi:hypothetical protein
MIIIEQSLPTCKDYTTNDPIHLFLQFYIDKDPIHKREICYALKKNVKNPHIDSIILLNERIYTDDELGITSSKIKQIVIHKRITYSDFLNYKIDGYKILVNADIFVDDTIQNVRTSDIHLHKKMYALLRYEYNNGEPTIFCRPTKTTGREDSQDTWIVHSNHSFTKKELNVFKIQLGTPGCDNKITYLFKILGYDIYNDPEYIKTYHCHINNTQRNYTGSIVNPFCHIFPANMEYSAKNEQINDLSMVTYSFSKSNTELYNMLQTNQPILIPRIAGVENNFVICQDFTVLQKLMPTMKKNAGIQFNSIHSIEQYKKWYLSAFEKCSVYATWEPWGNVYKSIAKTQNEIQRLYPKPTIWAFVYDIFHYIHKPWTHALANKRILIISAFADSIAKQPNAYPIDLFPNCTFIYLKPPQTNGSNASLDWHIEFVQFCNKVKRLENEFDVALCSCGGYGNPICSYIYSMNKTAIYVGGVLQMYFGVYGNRWLTERKDCMKLYMTPDWKRPSEHEKPLNHSSIESGCYW